MNSEEINKVVDNVSDKIGVAADKITPICQTVVEETSRLGAVQFATGCVGFVFVIAIIIIVSILSKKWIDHINDPDKKGEYAFIGMIPTLAIAGIVLFIASCATLYGGLSKWLAPTKTVLEEVLK